MLAAPWLNGDNSAASDSLGARQAPPISTELPGAANDSLGARQAPPIATELPELRNFTLEQLAGLKNTFSLKLDVFDVQRLDSYREHGALAHYVGHDASFAIATGAAQVRSTM